VNGLATGRQQKLDLNHGRNSHDDS